MTGPSSGATGTLAPGIEDEAIWQRLECGAYTADIGLWRSLVADACADGDRCALLELGCGVGRVSLALAGDGCRVTALDSDPALVDALRKSARATSVPIETLEGDVREFSLHKRFDLVIAPMQLVQLLRSSAERRSMFGCVTLHLKSSGHAAFALLDPEEHWEAAEDCAPVPDVCKVGEHTFSSQPTAVRVVDGDSAIELDRLRRVVGPDGSQHEAMSRMRLELLPLAEVRAEAAQAGLRQHALHQIPATDMHMGSTVIVFEPDA